jgi:hypothetical protein
VISSTISEPTRRGRRQIPGNQTFDPGGAIPIAPALYGLAIQTKAARCRSNAVIDSVLENGQPLTDAQP